MDLDAGLRDALPDEERRDLEALITLELDDLARLLIINEGPVAGKFLHDHREVSHTTSAGGRGTGGAARSRARLAFLNAFKSFLRSYSARAGVSAQADRTTKTRGGDRPLGRPCKVVRVLRPFRCWIRMWM